MKQPLDPLPIRAHASFYDLVFRPHRDGRLGHLHALHVLPSGNTVSITRGGLNDGEPGAPYEMLAPDGEIHAPLTVDDVTRLLSAFA